MLTMRAISQLETRIAPTIATVEGDSELIDLWLDGKSNNTKQAYRRDIDWFVGYLHGKPFQNVTLNDLQGYRRNLEGYRNVDGNGLSLQTIRRRINAVKSLFAFGLRIGVLAVNPAIEWKNVESEDKLSERILSESAVLRMIHGFKGSERDKAILVFLYATGCRVSELCALTWENCNELDNGNATISFHRTKSKKSRVVVIGSEVWDQIRQLRKDEPLSSPVFKSRKGNHLQRVQVNRIIKKAAKQAGIERSPSPHWFRHAHASHALKRGASIDLVSRSLGHASLDTTKAYLHADPGDSSGLYLGI